MNSAPLSAPRIVLDTNVCLDLIVFHDPSCLPLQAALRSGALQAVTRDDCREEWCAVVHYPELPIDDHTRPAMVAAFDALVQWLPPAAASVSDETCLPRCGDPDDQKFLQLALAASASWLLSKDKELLRLNRRVQNAGLFAILLPQAWALQ